VPASDALANVAIMAVGGLTLVWTSVWPDLLVGIGIFVMNLDAAREINVNARRERQELASDP
jgi:Co/Zn/Cd efflux system component